MLNDVSNRAVISVSCLEGLNLGLSTARPPLEGCCVRRDEGIVVLALVVRDIIQAPYLTCGGARARCRGHIAYFDNDGVMIRPQTVLVNRHVFDER